MSLRATRLRYAAGFVCLALLPAVALAGDRTMEVSTPPETILKRAAREKEPLWRVPLGAYLVDEMRLLSRNRLLVSLRQDAQGLANGDYLMVDTATGNVLWRFERKKKKAAFQSLLVLSDLLVFRAVAGKKSSLLALDPSTGAEQWSISVASASRIIPHPGAGELLLEQTSKRGITLTAISLMDGREIWTRSFSRGKDRPAPLPPMVVGRDLVHFYDGAERLSGSDGQPVWSHQGAAFEEDNAPPQVDGPDLMLLSDRMTLTLRAVESGVTRWTATLPDGIHYTNIFPGNEILYVRGILNLAGEVALGGKRHQLVALRRSDGEVLWRHASDEPAASNIVEGEELIYFGTPTSLVALEAASGQEAFSFQIHKTSQPYPVRVRLYPDRVVYIGELIVAACDPGTGEQLFSHGMTPVSIEAFLAGLDSAIPKLKEEMARLSGRPTGGASFTGTTSTPTFARQQIQRYQNMSNNYRHMASMSRSQGKFGDASFYRDMAYMQQQAAGVTAQIDSAFQSMQASINLMFSMLELRQALLQRFQTVMVQGALERQELFRQSILSAFAAGEAGEYVYRPHRKFRSLEDEFIVLSVVHLPTGRRRDTYLSPAYMSYGLWNLVDLERGVVYHHGLGLDPAQYKFSKGRTLPGYGKAKTIENFLIAAPIRIPQ
jgi:outer membrane protein assembly factor BamB